MTSRRDQTSGGSRFSTGLRLSSIWTNKAEYFVQTVVAAAALPGASLSWRTHVLLPAAALVWGTLLLVGADLDRVFASWLYAMEGGHWALKDAWVTENVIHTGGRLATAFGVLAALLATISTIWVRDLAYLRWPLIRLIASVALSTLIISVIKKHSGMDCPWDLSQFGGVRAYYSLFEARPAGLRASGCFPAGHASGGYAWLALYFFALSVQPRWRIKAFILGLSLGLIFGIGQQLRGAHFMSHDLWTAVICWFVALGIHQLSSARQPMSGALPDARLWVH